MDIGPRPQFSDTKGQLGSQMHISLSPAAVATTTKLALAQSITFTLTPLRPTQAIPVPGLLLLASSATRPQSTSTTLESKPKKLAGLPISTS